MARKLLDLPMAVAKAFIKDMRACHAEPSAIKRGEIAARQLHAHQGFRRQRENLAKVNAQELSHPPDPRQHRRDLEMA